MIYHRWFNSIQFMIIHNDNDIGLVSSPNSRSVIVGFPAIRRSAHNDTIP